MKLERKPACSTVIIALTAATKSSLDHVPAHDITLADMKRAQA